MKKWIGIGLLVVLICGAVLTLDWNRFGKEELYVQVGDVTETEEMKLDDGQIVKRYAYTTDAVKADGTTARVTFTAGKVLRTGAYLKLYVKDETTVTSYDEIDVADIPDGVREQL